MHPAPSVIIFTTFSGLGFGLLMFLGLGIPAVTGWMAFVFFVIAYVMAVGGLMASTFHLGHPERAMKAFTQWRSSWLSREGVCAVVALILMALYGAGLVFFSQQWTILGWLGARTTEPPISDVMAYAAIWDRHFQPFMRGRINTESLVYYSTLTFAPLMLATRILQSRRLS